MKKQKTSLTLVLLVLVSSLVSAEASFKHYLRRPNRQLVKTRVEYTANILLSWEAKEQLNRASSNALAEEAQTFIAKNIPTSSVDAFEGIVALGILQVAVTNQTLIDTDNMSRLWVWLLVDGIVIAEEESTFDVDVFPFMDIINTAIRAHGNEFHRLVEPLFAVAPSNDSTDSSSNKTLLIFVVILSIVLALVILLVVVKVVQVWRGSKVDADPPSADNDDSSDIQKREDDSIAENSLYTMRESAPSRSGSSVVPLSADENGGNLFNSFRGWSFSVSSEGDNSWEFDTNSADDNPARRSRYTIENVDDISIGGDVDVFEDQKEDEEDDMKTHTGGSVIEMGSFSQLGISPLEPPATEEEDLVDVDLDTSERTTKSRISVEDMLEFDSYIQRLPAPYKFQSRTPSEMSRERAMV